MSAVGGAFGFVFGAFGLLFAAFGIGMLIWMVRRTSAYKRTLREGLVAEARCLETFVMHRSSNGHGHSQRRQILGFRTSDGRDVRAQVASDQLYVVGDIVPVRYLPHRPEQAVPAAAPPGLGVMSYLTGAVLVVFTCIGLFFAALGFGLAVFMDSSVDDDGTSPEQSWTTEP
ncbi:DUF3592 domain-containing protein [Streptomyces sp. NBC_01142]|uniref:DUF3592 domain-containing protein n=1 Tax=Streptomyces sp. NBC_01142 TaxID=2975865 RepID=UPI0022511C68|nr:DUF3592 domain-containing protein [Streptomyces sp. NBC_01142]MCX4825643.1 DUF3592 domain-containing protein [Streptomyces sp. NBC_01142]